jgi:hypothetical protein
MTDWIVDFVRRAKAASNECPIVPTEEIKDLLAMISQSAVQQDSPEPLHKYLVLDLTLDKHARTAALVYARSRLSDNRELALEILGQVESLDQQHVDTVRKTSQG